MRRILLASILVLAPATFGFAQDTARAESETSFFMEGTNLRLEFVRDAGGVVTGLVVHSGTHQERATRGR